MAKCAVIIGSGIGGIATAIRLACKGYQVKVFEKNSYLGGKLTAFELDGFKFDAGPSLFTQPEYIEELFVLAKKDINKYFSYTKSSSSCKYFFSDSAIFNAPSNAIDFTKEASAFFKVPEKAIAKYLGDSKTAFENIGVLFTTKNLFKLNTYENGNLWRALKATKFAYLFQSLNNYNAKLRSKNLIQLFNRFATYNGSNPYKAPAMLSMIPHFEINVGTYYPYGGMINIVNALVALAKELGVNFYENSEVTAINVMENCAEGIMVNNKPIKADIVVSNMDVYYTYKKLLHQEQLAKAVLAQERSSSAYIFYWGINNSFKQLQLHNIFFAENYKEEFENIFKLGTFAEDITIYINITSKMEAGQAPSGCENWFVMVNAPAHKHQNWQEIQKKIRAIIIDKLNKVLEVDLEKFIVCEQVLSPKDIEQNTNSYMGSLYGSSSNSKMAAFARQQNKSKQFKNLFFVGGSVHPGGGIPLCLGSAKIVANEVA